MWFVLSLCGRETSSVELREKYWLRVFENWGGVGYLGVRRGVVKDWDIFPFKIFNELSMICISLLFQVCILCIDLLWHSKVELASRPRKRTRCCYSKILHDIKWCRNPGNPWEVITTCALGIEGFGLQPRYDHAALRKAITPAPRSTPQRSALEAILTSKVLPENLKQTPNN
jgi:hypothetical protein